MISRPTASRGMALILVLWMVAALSIIATGLLTTVKGEIRVASNQKQLVVASALADAALRRVLQDIAAQRPPIQRAVYIETPVPGQAVSVVVQPLGGLIDINRAPEPLLVALFQHGGEQQADHSALLARAVVEVRKRPDHQGRPQGLDAPEDLLQVPGIDYPLYATIVDLVSASPGGGGGVNLQAAPPRVLTVLLGGNSALASQFASARDSSHQPMDTAQFNPAFIEASPPAAIEVVARVLLPDGPLLFKTWRVSLAPSAQSGLPWQLLDIHQRLEAGGR